jgi:hypothetical protein
MSQLPDGEHEARTGEMCSRLGRWEGGDQHQELIDIKVGETFPRTVVEPSAGPIFTSELLGSMLRGGRIARIDVEWLPRPLGDSIES